jgi:hypothetical protein
MPRSACCPAGQSGGDAQGLGQIEQGGIADSVVLQDAPGNVLFAPDVSSPIQFFVFKNFNQLVGSHIKQLKAGANFLGGQNFFAVDVGVESAGAGFILVVLVLPAVEEQVVFVQEGELGNFADKFVISLDGKRRGLLST